MTQVIGKDGRRKVRWIIAHFPLELFVRAAKAFSVELEKICPGQFDIEIHTIGSYLKEYQTDYNADQLEILKYTAPTIPGLEEPSRTTSRPDSPSAKTFLQLKDWWKTFFQAMNDGKFEMSQTQVNIIGSHLHADFHAIDLPYLFKDHDHVSKALDGEIGQRISERVANETGIRALGYTYSGGYRIIGSTDGITKLTDLESKKFITFTAPSDKLFNYANIKHQPRSRTSAEDIGDVSENGGAIETTYLRFGGKNVLKTNHSMFMTSILTSEKFLSTLTEEQREAFREAAHRVAKVERIWSVEDAAKYEEQAEERGVSIVDISAEDEKTLRTAAKEVMRPSTLKAIGIDPMLVLDIMKLGKS